MVLLQARQADVQGLKGAAAAAAAGTSLQVKLTKQSAAKASDEAAGPVLTLDDGSILAEPNAIARFLGGSALCPAKRAAAISGWLEWESSSLRPAAYSGDSSRLQACLNKLAAALDKGKGRLVGGVNGGAGDLSLADVVVYCALLAVQEQAKAVPAVSAFLAAASANPGVQKATEQLLAGSPPSSFASTFALEAATRRAAAPRLPIKGQRNVLITSALPYVNNVPHLGNIIGCVLSADVYARYCRMRGYNTVYICGTDEYGTATETKALEEGLSCAQICDKYNEVHASIYAWFGIEFDRFGRTPTRHQTEIAQSIFRTLQERGCLVEQEMEQLYSEPLGKFLADRFVVGTCPKCKYEDARGDQCDGCGSLLNPTELVKPRCKLTGSTPVLRTTRHVFLDLPRLSPQLQAYIDEASSKGGWTANCIQVTRAWMRDGLKTRCITRDLKWGTPVPMEGYEDKVFYVWFDAPIGYISITADYCGDWKAWWMNPEDVELVQFMGKDNVPFHTVIFPATLLGTGQPWTLMRSISVTEYLNYENGKFSKSRGTGVFGNNARETGIPSDVWRYYLLACRPERSDTEFNWDDFRDKFTADLNDNLGNFVMRVLKFIHDPARFGGMVPTPCAKGEAKVLELGQRLQAMTKGYVEAMERQRLRDGIRAAIAVSAAGNLFFQENEVWKVLKADREEAGTLVSALAGVVLLLAGLLSPFMPATAASLMQQLNVRPEQAAITDELVERSARPHELLVGHQLPEQPPQQLFFKNHLDDAVVEQCRARYSGNQADDAAAAAAASTSAAAAPASAGGAAAQGGGGGAAKKAGADRASGADKASGGVGAKKEKGGGTKDGKKAEAKGGKGGGGPSDKDKPVDVSRLDLRVGIIRKAWRHPDADSLYVEEIDCGEAEPRTVVSGLVKYIPEPEMQGRRVVIVSNMKPAKMRGVASQAMVLAASSEDGSQVELVEPPAGAAVGERLTVPGFNGEPDEVLNPKHKVFDQVHPDLKTDDTCVACYRGAPLTTSAGPCTVKSIKGGGIR